MLQGGQIAQAARYRPAQVVVIEVQPRQFGVWCLRLCFVGRDCPKVCHFGVWPTGGRVVLIYSHVARHIAWDGLDEYEAYSTTKDHSLVAVYGGYARRLFRHLPTGGVSSTNHLENKT